MQPSLPAGRCSSVRGDVQRISEKVPNSLTNYNSQDHLCEIMTTMLEQNKKKCQKYIVWICLVRGGPGEFLKIKLDTNSTGLDGPLT